MVSIALFQKKNCDFDELENDTAVLFFSSNLICQKCPVCTKGPPLYDSVNLGPFGTKIC